MDTGADEYIVLQSLHLASDSVPPFTVSLFDKKQMCVLSQDMDNPGYAFDLYAESW